jgi:2,3-bisphosphoglycerate-dependent phosphoglycerate mutase
MRRLDHSRRSEWDAEASRGEIPHQIGSKLVTEVTFDARLEESGDLVSGTRLAIIRHGEAVANIESLIAGHAGCLGLTARGTAQCDALAERLARTGELAGAAALWTSVLPRAVESAAVIAPALGFATAEQSCSFCEQHPGEADGLSWSEYEMRYLRKSLPGDDPELPLSPGGESWRDFIDRASAALRALALRYPGQLTVVIAHGGVVMSSMIRFLELPDLGRHVQLHTENASITEWLYTGVRWRLMRFNDAAHLRGPDRTAISPVNPAWVDSETALPRRAQQVKSGSIP